MRALEYCFATVDIYAYPWRRATQRNVRIWTTAATRWIRGKPCLAVPCDDPCSARRGAISRSSGRLAGGNFLIDHFDRNHGDLLVAYVVGVDANGVVRLLFSRMRRFPVAIWARPDEAA